MINIHIILKENTMDVLSDILNTLKFKGSFYFSTNFTAPWGVQVPSYKNVARFHLAVGGDFWVKVGKVDDHIRLSSGDMIIIPHGAEHAISDKQDSPIEELDEVIHKSGYKGEGHLIYGGEDKQGFTKLVCGHFDFDEKFTHPLISELPEYILITGKQALDFSWFDDAMKFMSYEAQKTNIGNSALIKRLSEILFIHAIRVWNKQENQNSGFIRAIADKKIGRSLKAFHSAPEYNWTLESLAFEAGVSRSIFANQFRTLMGTTPLNYVTFWRMQKACERLIETDLSTDIIAEQVGYQSLAAFSKVFKKNIGVGPGSFRKENSEL